jgi:hypothetical protein
MKAKLLLTVTLLALATALLGAADVEASHSTYLPLVHRAGISQDWQAIPTPPVDCGLPPIDVHIWTCIDGTPVPTELP